jgi:hypothetical protein
LRQSLAGSPDAVGLGRTAFWCESLPAGAAEGIRDGGALRADLAAARGAGLRLKGDALPLSVAARAFGGGEGHGGGDGGARIRR